MRFARSRPTVVTCMADGSSLWRHTTTTTLGTRCRSAGAVHPINYTHDNAVSTEEIDARSLIDAIAKAHMMLKSRPHHETVEVWLGNSLAYCARKDRAAA